MKPLHMICHKCQGLLSLSIPVCSFGPTNSLHVCICSEVEYHWQTQHMLLSPPTTCTVAVFILDSALRRSRPAHTCWT
jgi:hypothetical protein